MTPPSLPQEAALFLDFDGVLVDIAPRPDAITVPAGLPELLSAAERRCGGALAIVSGRGVADLQRYLGAFDGALVGGHGAEVHPPGLAAGLAPAGHPDPAALKRALEAGADRLGLLYEPKAHGGVLHYRASPARAGDAAALARDLAAAHPGFAVQPAKMAVELRPAGARKDKAVAALMDRPPWAGRTPVYAGDDTTDEPAMALVQDKGGLAIKIGTGDSVARHRLADPAALADWLRRAAYPQETT